MQMWASPGGAPPALLASSLPQPAGAVQFLPFPLASQQIPLLLTFARGGFGGLHLASKPRHPQNPMSVAGGLGRDAQIRRSPAPRAPCVRGAASALLGARASAAGQAPRGRAAPRLVQPALTALVPTGRQTSADAGPPSLRKLSYFQPMNYFPRAVLNSSRSSAAPKWTLCDSASSFRLA